MYTAEINKIAEQSRSKADYLDRCWGGYFVLSALAGVYIGIGVTVVLSLGAPFVGSELAAAQRLVMGMTFGIALTLVVFAGAELFTGNNMICAIGALHRTISWNAVGRIWFFSFIGNLVGSLVLGWLVAESGVLSQSPQSDLLMKAAATKMAMPGWQLFLRGLLCNWLICLALWMVSRATNEVAKLILIFWCLLAFIGCGFEHSIANQSLFGMALFQPHPESVTWTAFLRNQVFVVLGNVVGGSVFVGGVYWWASAERESVTAQRSTLSPPPAEVCIGN